MQKEMFRSIFDTSQLAMRHTRTIDIKPGATCLDVHVQMGFESYCMTLGKFISKQTRCIGLYIGIEYYHAEKCIT